jgi:3-oxoacyl-[acyl-carrier protein] reductase
MVVPVSGPIDLTGKVALVTGGARGIGQSTCWSLAREGAAVAAVDLLPLEETLEGLTASGRPGRGFHADTLKKKEVEAAVHGVLAAFGRIDILVCNAGIYGPGGIEEITEEAWDRVIDINLRGAFFFCQQVWPVMKRQGGGKIVCLGSIAGRMGGVLSGPHYAASKGGIHAMVRWMATHGAPHGILVNGIAPGPVLTPMTAAEPYREDVFPVGRMGRAEDIAEAVVFLASQASNFVAGVVLDVNGGLFFS